MTPLIADAELLADIAAIEAESVAGCGVVSTTVMVIGAAVGAATTAAGVAVDGVVLVGKGVVKTGEVIAEAARDEPQANQQRTYPGFVKNWAATIILAGIATIMLAGEQKSEAA